MTSYRTIGILGGAGAAASAALVTRITDRVTASGARFDQDHPELVLINATRAPSRSMWLTGKGPSFLPAYIEAATRLKAAGADFALMCCNTAHAARAEIEAAAAIPVLDLITRALIEAKRGGTRNSRIGLLASDGVKAAGIYRKAALALWGTDPIVESSIALQARVTEGIIGVKRGMRRQTGGPSAHFIAAAEELRGNGADVIILGCTEIPLALGPDDWPHLPLVDTVDLLATMSLEACGFNEKRSSA